jgi:lichenan operon transcriptional antiterminator
MLTKRDVISYLNSSNHEVLTSKSIAAHFGVTPRTVQNYIKDIKEEYTDYIEISYKGIVLIKQIEFDQDNSIPLSFKERRSYILRILLPANKSVDLDSLASSLCISEVTLQNEIKKIRRYIEKFHLILKTKNNQLFITGTEKDKKALMIHQIYEEAENYLVSLSTLNDMFPKYDADKIHGIIVQKLDERKLFIDEYSLINLLLHILISMNQAEVLQTISYEEMDVETNVKFTDSTRHFITIIDELCDKLEEIYSVRFSKNNRYQFTLLLMTRAIRNKEIKEIEATKLSVDQDIIHLVNDIIRCVHMDYNIDLNINEFIIAFSLHIKNMLIRLKENVSVHNPLLFSIKSTSPAIYDIAVYVANIISKRQNVEMYDDEIAYIALHIGARIEELNSLREKLKVVVVCPHYYSSYSNQLKKIETYFYDDLMIDSILTNPKELDSIKYDFIVSTIPILDKNDCVIISTFFNEIDKENISNQIKRIKKSISRSKIANVLERLIDKELFETNCNYNSKEDAIKQMGNLLIQKGYVTNEFIEKLFEREKISPTNFGMIAIPHPIDYYSQRTILEISILEKPIEWGNSLVKIIFMFSISKFDFSDFSDIFSFLANICNDDKNIEYLISSRSYDDFIKNILTLY